MPRFPRSLTIAAVLALATLAATATPAFAAAPECDTVEAMPSLTTKETFHIAGDGDATIGSDIHGMPGHQRGANVVMPTAAGHPMCFYSFGNGGDILVEVDVYKIAGEPMRLHLLCPHCLVRDHAERNALNISADRKHMEYDPLGMPKPFPGWSERQMIEALPNGAGGLLSVSTPFKCTWEVDPRHRERIGNICDWEVVIEKNVIRRVNRTNGVRTV